MRSSTRRWPVPKQRWVPTRLRGLTMSQRPSFGLVTWTARGRLTPGEGPLGCDVVFVDLGMPMRSEAGFVRPAVVVSAAGLLRRNLATIFVVPCTTTFRNVASHTELLADEQNGLSTTCWAQVDQLRSIAVPAVSNGSATSAPWHSARSARSPRCSSTLREATLREATLRDRTPTARTRRHLRRKPGPCLRV